MKKLLTTIVVTLSLLAGIVAFSPAASAEGIEATDVCPELTDSVVRLYSAYFLRAPDADGIDYWLTEYSEGRWSLPAMSRFFSDSDEFESLYGTLSNREFVDLIYRNILGRSGEPSGVDFWTGRLDSGALNRGQVMLSFSEGPEYVARTGTARPMAGYYQSYPTGAQWFCGTENRSEIAFSPGGTFYADGFAALEADASDTENFSVRSVGPNRELNSLVVNEIVENGTYVYFWNGLFDTVSSWQDTEVLEVRGIEDPLFRWAIVVYPTSIGDARGGLGDDVDSVNTGLGRSSIGCSGCDGS